MRRPTLIVLIVLFTLLVVAGVWQLLISTEARAPFPGPTSPGQLPSVSPSA